MNGSGENGRSELASTEEDTGNGSDNGSGDEDTLGKLWPAIAERAEPSE